MKRVVLIALAVSGCATRPPAVEVRTVEVPVIRAEKCVAEKDIPKRPAGLPSPRPKNITSALDVAVAKVLELTSYAEKADALLRGCAG